MAVDFIRFNQARAGGMRNGNEFQFYDMMNNSKQQQEEEHGTCVRVQADACVFLLNTTV